VSSSPLQTIAVRPGDRCACRSNMSTTVACGPPGAFIPFIARTPCVPKRPRPKPTRRKGETTSSPLVVSARGLRPRRHSSHLHLTPHRPRGIRAVRDADMARYYGVTPPSAHRLVVELEKRACFADSPAVAGRGTPAPCNEASRRRCAPLFERVGNPSAPTRSSGPRGGHVLRQHGRAMDRRRGDLHDRVRYGRQGAVRTGRRLAP
jgi:hypothetical protein